MFNNVISQATAKEIIGELLKESKVKLPACEKFVKEGARVGILLECYREFRSIVNNGSHPSPVKFPYEYSIKFHKFVASHFPTEDQVEMNKSYKITYEDFNKPSGLNLTI